MKWESEVLYHFLVVCTVTYLDKSWPQNKILERIHLSTGNHRINMSPVLPSSHFQNSGVSEADLAMQRNTDYVFID